MHADSSLHIGKSHSVCEDYTNTYTASTADNTSVLAVLSDGCSGSEDTDIGARLLCLSSKHMLEQSLHCGSLDLAFTSSINHAHIMSKAIGVDKYCLDATLLALVSTENSKYLEFFAAGDGYLALKNKEDNSIEVAAMKYRHNMPFYLSYMIDAQREKLWYDKMSENTEPANLTKVYTNKSGSWEEKSNNFHMDRNIIHQVIYKKNLEWACVISDGVETFSHKDENGNVSEVSVFDVLDEILNFKSTKGMFVQRRLNAFFRNTSWQHSDDVSICGICFL